LREFGLNPESVVAGIAVKMKATKADFDATIVLHPTATEELGIMRTLTALHVRLRWSRGLFCASETRSA
jgi:hypothetical protein